MKSLLLIIVPAFLLIWLTPLGAEAKVFETESYSVNIPKGCNTEDEPNRFSSDALFDCKSKDYAFHFELAGSPWTGTDDELADQLLQVIKDKWGYTVEEVERGSDKYTFNNKTAPYVQATYEQAFTTLFGLPGDPEDWVYMVVGIKMADDVLYAQFKSSEGKFDNSLDDFEKVLNSIETKDGNSKAKKVTCFEGEDVENKEEKIKQLESIGKAVGKPIDCVPKSELNSTDTDTKTTKEDDGPTSTTQGDDFAKSRAVCDTVTTQSGKDLCETLLN